MIAYPHRIRLRGPWECQLLTELPGKPLRMSMPCSWVDLGLPPFSGRVRFSRSFGYPGRIDAHERVWLTLAGLQVPAEVFLNGHFLGKDVPGAFEFDVTSLLGRRNRLEIILTIDPDRAGLWDEAALEIRAAAYLRDVQAYRINDQLCVDGVVAGASEKPLELYVLVDRYTVAYRPIAAGENFHLLIAANDIPARPQALRVELVNLSAVWYGVEMPWPQEGG